MPHLTIASSLSAYQNAALHAHAARPHVLELTAAPWLVPSEAEALFTYQMQWRTAPASAPAGWPGRLRWIQVASAGVDVFPPWFYQVPLVTRGRGVQSPAIAEYVIGAIFAHEKQFWDSRAQARSEWQARMLGGVAGKRLGIAGFGSIGGHVADLAQKLGMTVSALTRSDRPLPPDVTRATSMAELMATSDHVVLAMPLTKETRGMVTAACLATAKPGLHLINVARGAVIDDDALVTALDRGQIAAATLDVTHPEPLPDGHPFYSHPAIRLTPHVSGGTEGGESRLAATLAANLDAFLAGRPPDGVVNRDVGY